MSGISAEIEKRQDKDGMLRRALERIIQLYTDKSHFVYELLQNAEDAEAKCVQFVQYEDRLEVFHDGKPFTVANFQALCDIGLSDKLDNLNKIGEFGVGFKSVFSICDTVFLYSDPSHYSGLMTDHVIPFAERIDDFVDPKDIQEEPIDGNYTTRFVFPYQAGKSFSGFKTVDELKIALSSKLQDLGITTLLFMKNLELIKYEIRLENLSVSGEYLLDKERINDHCQMISAVGISDKQDSGEKNEKQVSYLLFSRKPEQYQQRTVDIAFAVQNENGIYNCVKAPNQDFVSVYFPTYTESKLDFIVQGPYRTTPNRESIPPTDPDNIMLAKETARLLRDSLLELRNLGKLNMSFVKVLPLSKERIGANGLFFPLYETVRDLFRTEAIIPSKSGEYVRAQSAKISRSEKMAELFSDDQLSSLVNDGNKYYWLPTYVTGSSREYESVFRYLTSADIKVPVIQPEDLRLFFDRNNQFLPQQSNDWLAELYESIFASIPGSFSKAGSSNMLTVAIVKTSTGSFVAPFRREGKAFIPNVFLSSPTIQSDEIHFVDGELYKRCPSFFDDVLSLQKPNEYEFVVKDIERRYSCGQIGNDKQHIDDIRALLRFIKNEDYKDEINRIIKTKFLVKCKDGKFLSPYDTRIFVSVSSEGIRIEDYYLHLGQVVTFVDQEFYSQNGIDESLLIQLGVKNSILIWESIVDGVEDIGLSRNIYWKTGDNDPFRRRLSIDALKEALMYISEHPTASDAPLKSKAILKLLLLNESRLSGLVFRKISGKTVSNEESCEMMLILLGERMFRWNGQWLYTRSMDLVSPKDISRHELSVDIYGQDLIEQKSKVFNQLGFQKTDDDIIEELESLVPEEALNSLFKRRLWEYYNITPDDLQEIMAGGPASGSQSSNSGSDSDSFPIYNVKSWDALRKHAAEMLIYADPVTYEKRVREIRTSNHPREIRAYLKSMYRQDGYKYACQLCHKTCEKFEAVELFPDPETELDPVNLLLCPNCATYYRGFRSDSSLMAEIKDCIFNKKEGEIQKDNHVVVILDDENELWFTQTHFAEIQELMHLQDETKHKKPQESKILVDENEQSGMSVYSGYVGKKVFCKLPISQWTEGIVRTVDDNYLTVEVIKGKEVGKKVKITLDFILSKTGIYSFSD